MAKKKKKDDIKNTLLKAASTAKNIAIKSNSDTFNNAKNVSVPRPTTTLSNATNKVLSTPKITPKSTVKKPTSTSAKTPTIKSSSLPTVSSNPKVQKMAENSTQWNRLEAQKNLLLKQNPNQNVSALTNKQNLLHKNNTDLGLDLGLKFAPSGSWTNSSGNKAYDVGTTNNGYISPVSPLALLTQLNSAMPKPALYKHEAEKAASVNKINQATQQSLKEAGQWLLHNTAAGAAGFASSITNTVDMVLPDRVTPSFLQSYFDHNRKTNEEWQQISGSTNSEGGTASEIAGTVYQAGVQAVPAALAAIASGGSSLASQLGQAGNAVSKLITSLPFWTSFAQTAGNEYFKALENGANELQASLTGMTSGAVGGAIERMGGIDTLLGNKAQGVLRTAAEEAGEEVLQDITSGLINKAAYDTGREWFGTGDSDAVINPQRLAMNAGAGAILGGAVGGVNAAINSRANINNTITDAKQAVSNPESAVVDVKVNGQSVSNIEIPTPIDTQFSTSYIKINPKTHTLNQIQQINKYINSTDKYIVQFINDVKSGKTQNSYQLSDISDKAAKDIYNAIGVDASGFKTKLEPRIIKHILQRHGDGGTADNSMSDVNDIARMQYILDNYDYIIDGGNVQSYKEPKPNQPSKTRGAKSVIYAKKIDGTYYLVQAVPNTKKKTSYIVSAYIQKKEAPKDNLMMPLSKDISIHDVSYDTSGYTSENDSTNLTTNNILHNLKIDNTTPPTLLTVAQNHIDNMLSNTQSTQNTSVLSNQTLQNNTSVNVENVTSKIPLQVPTLRTVAENHIAETMAKAQSVNNSGTLKQGIWQEGEVKPKLKPEYETRPEPKLPMKPEEQNILEMQLDAFEKANNILPLPGFNPETQTFEQPETVGQIIDNAIADAQNTKTTTDQTINSNTEVDTQQDSDVVNILSAWKNIWNIDRQIEQFEKDNALTIRDKEFVENALLTNSTANINKTDNLQNAIALLKLKKLRKDAYKPIAEYNQANKSNQGIQAMEWAEYIAQYATDKAGWQYFLETPERNAYDIFGKNNRHLAQQFIDTFLTPVHKDVAKSNKLMNDYRSRVKKLKLNKHESAIVQYMIENEVAGANKYITDNKIKMTKEKTEKIDNAVAEFRAIYKELLDKINTALIRNGYEPVQSLGDFYAPHFMEKLSDRKLARLLYQFGMKITKKDQIPTDLAGVTEQFRPGKKWFGNLEHRTGTKTIYDAVRGFDNYIETAADVITLTDSIQRLRSLEDAVRYRLSDEGTQMEIDAVKNDIQLNALQKREKIEGIYSQEQTHIEKIKQLLSQKDAGMRNFVTDLRRYTDNLAGKKARGDRGIEDIIGREVYEISRQVQGRVAANMIAANPGSWLTNMIPLTQATGEIHTVNLLSGMWDTIKAYMKNDGFVDTSAFLTNRRGSSRLVQSKIDKIGNALGSPMEFIDQFVADSIVRAKTKENIQNGMDLDAAIDEADAFAGSLMADRSKGAMPAAFNIQNPFVKPFTMFQLEVNNQLRYLGKDIPRRLGEQGGQAIAAALVNIFAGAYIYNNLYEKLTGRRAALDPVSMIKDTFNIIDDDERENSDKIQDTFTTYAQQLPFIGGILGGGRLPIGAVLPDFSNLLTVFNANVPTKKRIDIVASELANPAAYLLLPFGGGAAKKAYEGFNLIQNKGAYRVNDDGEDELMFAANGNAPTDYLQAMLFGKYSSENAQNYINSGFKVLSSDYTKMYKQLVNTYGIDNNTAYDSLMNVYTTQAKAGGERKPNQRLALMNTDLPAEAKEHIDRFLFRSNSDENIIDYSNKAHFDITMNVKHKYLDNALYLHDELGVDGDATVKLIRNSMFGSTDNLGKKNEQIYTIIDNINKMNVSDDIKNYAFSEIVAPQISDKYASEQGKQLLQGIPMDLAMTSYYQRDLINEEIDNDNTIHPLDKDDYKKLGWQNYLDEYATEFGLSFEQKENLRYFLANGQSTLERDWDYYAMKGSDNVRPLVEQFKNSGLDVLKYQVIRSGMEQIFSDKNADGTPVKDSKKRKLIAYLDQWGLDDNMKNLMLMADDYKYGLYEKPSSSKKKSSSSKKSSGGRNSKPKVKGGFSDFSGF